MPSGTNNTRFEIIFVSKTININNYLFDNFNILQNNIRQNFTVANPKSLYFTEINAHDI